MKAIWDNECRSPRGDRLEMIPVGQILIGLIVGGVA